MLNIFEKARAHAGRTAIIDTAGSYSYDILLKGSNLLAGRILENTDDLSEARVGFMVRPGYEYVVMQWAIWRSGGIAVPICVTYPSPSIQYILEDAQISRVLATAEFSELLKPLCQQLQIDLMIHDRTNKVNCHLPDLKLDRRAMILYTSGTTGKPKGVVTTHAALEAQITALTNAWEWQQDDHILNILPLHHVHGIVNVLSCALWSGACCEFLPEFDPSTVMSVFKKKRVNLFMAVPTIYYKLIAYYETLTENEQNDIRRCMKDFRLMVSGSAALPVSTLEKWQHISGHILLERYGMTEMGMAISNSYRGRRYPGCIGLPLPNVAVRLRDENNRPVLEGEPGEIQVKGPNVFKEYWNKPDATKSAFTDDGWFYTGDTAIVTDDSVYKILGRNSVDIIKSGGYKISALEIQEVLRQHPEVRDCAVVGLSDPEWGELIAAALITSETGVDFEDLKTWLKERLPGYKIPRRYLVLEELPRNAMGKVTKHLLPELFSDKKLQ